MVSTKRENVLEPAIFANIPEVMSAANSTPQNVEWVEDTGKSTIFDANKSSPSFNLLSLFKTITIPTWMTAIGAGCFSGSEWENLEHINIPNTISSIGSGAFIGCAAMKELTIPGSVRTIGSSWIHPNLEKLTIDDGLEEIGPGFISGDAALLKELKLPSTLKKIGSGAMGGCLLLTSLELPEGLTYIGGGCMLNGITYISIPGSVQTMEGGAFSGCKALKKVDIQEGVPEIRSGVFVNCAALEEVNIPASVETIGTENGGAFSGCTALTEININKPENSIEGAPWGAPETCKINWLG